jgi:hypothetical protein
MDAIHPDERFTSMLHTIASRPAQPMSPVARAAAKVAYYENEYANDCLFVRAVQADVAEVEAIAVDPDVSFSRRSAAANTAVVYRARLAATIKHSMATATTLAHARRDLVEAQNQTRVKAMPFSV